MVDGVPMKQQYASKFLPDIDGNSFSGRYRAFLLSTSLPFKSTIYAEWHDDRLFPWVHFVPMDNSFIDLYGLVDYFIDAAHDAEARTMADEGKAWAETVLRRQDMKLYVWRLLLEYARVVNDDRHRLAFVADLTG
ncbi:capsule associated protein [Ophiocordyceps sinensis CO18]|nr:capsule associated protein [Ophiocordyceps sinensis CO18]